MSDTWDPWQYERFRLERDRPVTDLLALVRRVPGGRVLDLGCGTGELTRRLHEQVGAATTLGVDASKAMLERARPGNGVSFELGDLTDVADPDGFDLVFANASLQWVADHERLFDRVWALVRAGGQLAVQVPANFHHPSHTIADRLGQEHGLEALDRTETVLSPSDYATLLHDLGAVDEHVRLVVYGARLDRTDDVVEWVKGSLLTHYRRELGDERFAGFLDRYHRELLETLGDPSGAAPYYFPFERILMSAHRPAGR